MRAHVQLNNAYNRDCTYNNRFYFAIVVVSVFTSVVICIRHSTIRMSPNCATYSIYTYLWNSPVSQHMDTHWHGSACSARWFGLYSCSTITFMAFVHKTCGWIVSRIIKQNKCSIAMQFEWTTTERERKTSQRGICLGFYWKNVK